MENNKQYFYILASDVLRSQTNSVKMIATDHQLQSGDEELKVLMYKDELKILGALEVADVTGVCNYFKNPDHMGMTFEYYKTNSDEKLDEKNGFYVQLTNQQAINYLKEAAKFYSKGRLFDGGDWRTLPKCFRVPFKFSMIGLKAGDEIVFRPTQLTVKIASDDEVEYQGVKYYTSNFVQNFMPIEKKISSNAYQGPLFFDYKGQKLDYWRREASRKAKVALNLALDADEADTESDADAMAATDSQD